MFMYPDNLKGKPTLWLWYLRDIGVIGIGAIFSVIAISQYAFLTIRFNDTSIFDFLQYACAFFIYHQQIYYWEYTGFVSAGNNENYYRKRKIWR